MNNGRQTPWGEAEAETELAPGIVNYSTPSHGGIWLSPERQRQLQYRKNWLNDPAWWEEDCDWAVPFVFFAEDIRRWKSLTPERFADSLRAARETVKACHPVMAEHLGL